MCDMINKNDKVKKNGEECKMSDIFEAQIKHVSWRIDC